MVARAIQVWADEVFGMKGSVRVEVAQGPPCTL